MIDPVGLLDRFKSWIMPPGGHRVSLPPPADHPEPVRLMHASTPAEAQVVAALLRAAGILVYVGGRRLSDEFAVSQATMGLAQVDVQVPADRLEEAQALLEQARREGGGSDS
jgi:hypothetical protein